MRKVIFLFVLFLVSMTLNAQTLTTYYYNGGISYGVSATLDSTKTSTVSPYFDWSLLDGQTNIYLTVSLVQANFGARDGRDTIIVILKGKDGLNNVVNLDTTAIITSTTMQLGIQRTLSLSGYLPYIAFEVQTKVTGGNKNLNSGLLKATIYTPNQDIIPPRNYIYW